MAPLPKDLDLLLFGLLRLLRTSAERDLTNYYLLALFCIPGVIARNVNSCGIVGAFATLLAFISCNITCVGRLIFAFTFFW